MSANTDQVFYFQVKKTHYCLNYFYFFHNEFVVLDATKRTVTKSNGLLCHLYFVIVHNANPFECVLLCVSLILLYKDPVALLCQKGTTDQTFLVG